MARVSVVIPTYNYARYVGNAIQSVLEQTVGDCEIVVVDDGSTDETADVVSRFGSRVLYIFQPNRGLSAARNRGIQEASGKWIGFLDADDLWLPSKIERQFASLRGNDERVVLHSNAFISDESGKKSLCWQYQVSASLQKGLQVEDLLLRNWINVSTGLVARSVLLSIGGFDERLLASEDWDLWLRLGLAGYQFVYVEEPLAIYRHHEANMHKNVDRMRTAQLRVLDTFFSRPDLPYRLRRLRRRAYVNTYYSIAAARYHSYSGTRRIDTIREIFRMLACSPRWGAAQLASLFASRFRLWFKL